MTTPSTIVVASADDITMLREELAKAQWIALDTEFHGERRYRPHLLLVQVYVPGGHAWILDPLVSGLLPSLAEDLTRPGWILHGGSWDLRLLQETLGRLPRAVRDTQVAAGLVATRFPASLTSLVRRYLDLDLDKGEALSDWSRRPLHPNQLRYASLDVTLLPKLWARLAASAPDAARLAMLEQASGAAASEWLAGPDETLLWTHLPGADNLDAKEAAIARALVAWREGLAQRADQPPRNVLSDGWLLNVARDRLGPSRLPSRGVDRALAAEANEIAAKARQSDPKSWPTVLSQGSDCRARYAWWGSLAETSSAHLGVASALVWPVSLLRTLATSSALDDEALLHGLLGWRAPLVGGIALGSVRGTVSLSLAGMTPRIVLDHGQSASNR